MVSLCTIHTFQDIYGTYAPMIPEGYEHVYSSVPTALDNKFEIFKKGDLAVIEIRGSTAKMMSWMVNVHTAMIPAKSSILINGNIFEYNFASDTAAAVHAGYTLAIATIAPTVVAQLNELNDAGIDAVIITGHSQGGALANLLRSYLEHLPSNELSDDIYFKTYAFAAPMVGNKEFAIEYEREFCTKLSSFNIVELADMVPNMPASYKEGRTFTIQNIMGAMFSEDENMKSLASNAIMNMFSGSLTSISQYSSRSIENKVEGTLGEVEMPAFRNEWNYSPLKERIELEPFLYPLILNDSTIFQNDSVMRFEPRDSNGDFENKALYRKTPGSFHHKPYNYYVGILKRYFPEEYKQLDVKILPENL